MKFFLLILIVFCTHESISQCTDGPPYQTTNPESPYNPTIPSGYDEFLNSFNWYQSNGLSLIQYHLDGMNYQTGIDWMIHPFSVQNEYDYLLYDGSFNEIELPNLDMYPKDGWELLSLNIGQYPNGVLYSDGDLPSQSGLTQIPYIILYNKQRGIIRLFANCLTGVENGFDNVLVELAFNSADFSSTTFGYSGLLRYHDGYDIALDQTTTTKSILSSVIMPNSPSQWFHTDFQVGYDPCTCLFGSDLRIKFYFTNTSQLKMTSRSISVDLPILDADGNHNVDNGFLTGVQYDEGFTGSGIVVYSNMDRMIQDYITRLEYTKNQNIIINANNAEIERKLAILRAFKTIIIGGASNIISGDLASKVTTFANEIITAVEVGGPVEISKDELNKAASSILGKGFDFYSNNLKKGLRTPLNSPTMPMATISETTFDGELTDYTIVNGPTIMNPGTYPNAINNVAMDIQKFPLYNEVLGLFALLETPKFDRYFHINASILDNQNIWSDYPAPYIDANGTLQQGSSIYPVPYGTNSYYDWSITHLNSTREEFIQLHSPLKYTLNPASGMDIEHVEVSCALVIKPQTSPNPSPTHFGNELTYQTAIPEDYLSAPRSISLNNLTVESGSTDLLDETLLLESSFLPIDQFSALVISSNFTTENTWKNGLFSQDEWGVWIPISDGAIDHNYEDLEFAFDNAMASMIELQRQVGDFSEVKYLLKIMVKMPFQIDGETSITTEVYTYDISSDQFIDQPTPLNIPFSTTSNPNSNGTSALAPSLIFNTKSWSYADYVYFGGITNNIIQPFAISQIHIIGNQSQEPNISETVMIAGEEIIINGDVTISGNFNLRINNFLNIPSSPNPPVSQSYLASYCSGQVNGTYNANSSRMPSRNSKSFTKQSLKEEQANLSFHLFPNPANNTINIRMNNSQHINSLVVSDILGNEILRLDKSNLSDQYFYTLDTASLQSGSYNLRCTFDNGNMEASSFIVMH